MNEKTLAASEGDIATSGACPPEVLTQIIGRVPLFAFCRRATYLPASISVPKL